jgi:hypothetical protein
MVEWLSYSPLDTLVTVNLADDSHFASVSDGVCYNISRSLSVMPNLAAFDGSGFDGGQETVNC